MIVLRRVVLGNWPLKLAAIGLAIVLYVGVAGVDGQLAYATLPVVPRVDGSPADDRILTSIRVMPAVATIGGSEGAVRNLAAIATAPIDVAGLAEDIAIEVPLDIPDGVEVSGVSMVRVEIEFAPSLGSRAFEVATGVIVPSGPRTYDVGAASVRVVLAGPSRALDDIDVSALLAVLPVADLDAGDHLVVPEVSVPDALELVRIEPAEVRVRVGEGA